MWVLGIEPGSSARAASAPVQSGNALSRGVAAGAPVVSEFRPASCQLRLCLPSFLSASCLLFASVPDCFLSKDQAPFAVPALKCQLLRLSQWSSWLSAAAVVNLIQFQLLAYLLWQRIKSFVLNFQNAVLSKCNHFSQMISRYDSTPEGLRMAQDAPIMLCDDSLPCPSLSR